MSEQDEEKSLLAVMRYINNEYAISASSLTCDELRSVARAALDMSTCGVASWSLPRSINIVMQVITTSARLPGESRVDCVRRLTE